MTATIRSLTLIGCALIFLLSNNALEMIGWRSGGGSPLTKFSPSFYILLITAVLALAAGGARYWNTVRQPRFFLFFIAAVLAVVRGATISSTSGQGGGELSAAVVTWLTPALMLVGLASLDSVQLARAGMVLRAFFVVNSLLGLTERLLSTHLVPLLIDGVNDPRAAALLGHPLNASMLTGIMIVHLASARAGDRPIAWRIPELLIHGMAMFAFGGRSALVATVAVILFSSVVARQERGERGLSALQRALPYLVLLAGLILILAPLPFVDATLDRFANDRGSSDTRNAAVQMIGFLSPRELLLGVDFSRRLIIQQFFHSPYGIELAWVALTMIYGLLVTIPLAVSLFFLMFRTAAELDRSAFYMAIAFAIITAGSLSIGSKSALISETLMMMIMLAQRRYVSIGSARQPARASMAGADRRRARPAFSR